MDIITKLNISEVTFTNLDNKNTLLQV